MVGVNAVLLCRIGLLGGVALNNKTVARVAFSMSSPFCFLLIYSRAGLGSVDVGLYAESVTGAVKKCQVRVKKC